MPQLEDNLSLISIIGNKDIASAIDEVENEIHFELTRRNNGLDHQHVVIEAKSEKVIKALAAYYSLEIEHIPFSSILMVEFVKHGINIKIITK